MRFLILIQLLPPCKEFFCAAALSCFGKAVVQINDILHKRCVRSVREREWRKINRGTIKIPGGIPSGIFAYSKLKALIF